MANSAHPSIVPVPELPAADGWIVIAAAKQKFWERLCEAIGRPDLREDPRFAAIAARNEHRDVLLPMLDATLPRGRPSEWLERSPPPACRARAMNSVARGARGPADARARRTSSSTTIRRSAPCARSLAASPRAARRQPRCGARAVPGRAHGAVLVELCGYAPERVVSCARPVCSARSPSASPRAPDKHELGATAAQPLLLQLLVPGEKYHPRAASTDGNSIVTTR